MDFFEAQERARRRSRWLVLWYAAAVLGVVASYCALAAFGYWLVMQSAMLLAGHLAVASLVGGFILTVSAWRMWQLSDGGAVIAHVLGARHVDPDKCTPTERRLINVVEEMAIVA